MKGKVRVKKYTRDGILLNLYLVLLFLLPQSMTLYLTAPIGMLLVSNYGNNHGGKWSIYGFVAFIIILISTVVNVNENWVDSKSYLRALQLIVFFFCFGKTRSTEIYKGTLIFIIIYLALFQFAGLLHLGPIVDLSYTLYPLSEKAELAFERSLNMSLLEAGGYNERLFGIYHNANNCAIYTQILLILLVIEKDQFNGKKWGKMLYFILLIIVVLMLMAAGSRTSFIVLVAIGLTMFGSEIKTRSLEIGLIILLFVLLVSVFGIELRMFKVGDGMNSSLGFKVQIVEDYLSVIPSVMKILFGCFTCQALIPLLNTSFPGTDMDFGDMFVQYGLLFLIFIFVFLNNVFFSLNKKYRHLFWILLWMFSNTIICNYRTSSIMLLVFSIYVLRSQNSVLINKSDNK